MTITSPPPPMALMRRVRATPAWWRSSSRDALVVSLLLVTGLWACPHGLTDLAAGPAAALTSLGRLTGLVASDLLLVQVLLMARVPLLERAWGQDELARLHRLVGFSSFNLMLAHVVLIGLGYAGADGRGYARPARRAVGHDLGPRRHAAGRRRHALPGHGRRDQRPRRPPAAALRVLAPAAPVRLPRRRARAAAPALDRRGLPGQPAGHRLLVDGVGADRRRASSSSGSACRCTGPCGTGWSWRRSCPRRRASCRCTSPAGTSTSCRCAPGSSCRSASSTAPAPAAPTRTRCRPPRPSTACCASPSRTSATAAAQVARLRPGTRVLVEGPYGRLTAERRSTRKVLLLGAGIGITPLRALAEELPQAARRRRRRAPRPLARRGRVPRRARAPRAHPRPARGAGARPARRRTRGRPRPPARTSAAALRALVPDVAEREVFVCGPDAWMDAALAAARAAGVPAERAARRALQLVTVPPPPVPPDPGAPRAPDPARPHEHARRRRHAVRLPHQHPHPATVATTAVAAGSAGDGGTAAAAPPRRRTAATTATTAATAPSTSATVTGERRADPLGPGAGADHRRGGQGHRGDRRAGAVRQRPRRRDQRATPCPCSTQETVARPERRHRRRLRRDRHQRRLRHLAAVGARPGRAVSAVAPPDRRTWVEHVMGLPVSVTVRGAAARDRARRPARAGPVRRPAPGRPRCSAPTGPTPRSACCAAARCPASSASPRRARGARPVRAGPAC